MDWIMRRNACGMARGAPRNEDEFLGYVNLATESPRGMLAGTPVGAGGGHSRQQVPNVAVVSRETLEGSWPEGRLLGGHVKNREKVIVQRTKGCQSTMRYESSNITDWTGFQDTIAPHRRWRASRPIRARTSSRLDLSRATLFGTGSLLVLE